MKLYSMFRTLLITLLVFSASVIASIASFFVEEPKEAVFPRQKFLGCFTDYPLAASTYNVAKGVNNAAPYLVELPVAVALVNTDTVTVTLPGEYRDWVPQLVGIWSPATPRLPITNAAITSHNSTTGVTLITASGAVAQNSTILLAYYPSSRST